MPEPGTTIFRQDALRRYVRGREETVLPRHLSARTAPALWCLLALLVIGGGLVWLVPLPVRLPGLAVVVEPAAPGRDSRVETALAVFLPPAYQTQLRRGQLLSLRVSGEERWLRRPIAAIETTMQGPGEIGEQFHLAGGAGEVAPQIAAVVYVPRESAHRMLFTGSGVHPIEVVVGRRPMLSLLSSGGWPPGAP